MPSRRVVVTAALNGVIMSCALSPASAHTHHHHHTVSNYHHEWRHDAFRHGSYHFAFHHRHLTTASSARWSCSWWCGETERFDRYKRPHATRHSFSHGRSRTNRLAEVGSVNGSLGAKAREIVQNCGSAVISGFRPGARIAGSGPPSLHASGRAVDIRGNPSCIYAHLHSWPGGYSIDYGAVEHVHISLGGNEDGLRFSHYSSHSHHDGHNGG